MTWLWQPLLPGGAQLLAGGGTISGAATQTLAPYSKTQTGTLAVKGSGSQTLSDYAQTATGKAIITGQQ